MCALMSLRLLEPSVRVRLRSGVALSSISQCVQELVENSIDAEASCVAVHIDVSRFKIQVRKIYRDPQIMPLTSA